MTWSPLTSPVDYIVLAGQRSPGIADVERASTPRRWDERRQNGSSGATLVFRGQTLSRFTVRLRLYTDQHWADWDSWRPLVQRPPAPTVAGQSLRSPRALEIQHPILDQLGIRSVVVEDLLQPVQTGDGEWTVEIHFIEFRAPVPALSRPEGSQERPQAPVDPVEVLIGSLSDQVQRLGRGEDV